MKIYEDIGTRAIPTHTIFTQAITNQGNSHFDNTHLQIFMYFGSEKYWNGFFSMKNWFKKGLTNTN